MIFPGERSKMSSLERVVVSVTVVLCVCGVQLVSSVCPPLIAKRGIDLKCEIPDTKSKIDCNESDMPIGTEAYYECEPHFVNPDGETIGGKLICSPQGRWIRFNQYQDFICSPECGRARNSSLMTVSSFIDRDHDLTDEIFPWHVAIFRRFADTNTFKYACGATLINPADRGFVILTAAHCVTKHDASAEPGSLSNFKIVLGPISTDYRTNVIGNAQIFNAKRIVIDGEYNPDSGISDIGMIELNGQVKLSETVQPVCFPTRSVANAQVRPGIPGEVPIIRNDQLVYQEILQLPVVELGKCIRECDIPPTNTEFCASGNRLNELNTGSGIVFSALTTNPKRYFLQGILTRVAGESQSCLNHNTFTSVSIFVDWVHKVHEDISDVNKIEGQTLQQLTTPPPTLRPEPQAESLLEQGPNLIETPQQPEPDLFTPDFLKIGLDRHNSYRRKHQSTPVQLDPMLTKDAQEWAEHLLRENKWEFAEGQEYSQNIFQYFGKVLPNDVIRKAVDNWYEAISKYNWQNPEASTFSQLVWKSTTHIGIGVANKGSKSVVVTNYWPKGNIYNIGPGDRGKYFKDNVLPPTSIPLGFKGEDVLDDPLQKKK